MSTHKKFTFTGALTQEQIDFFNVHGFIYFEHYTTEETVQAILASTEAVQEQWIAHDIQKGNGVPIKYAPSRSLLLAPRFSLLLPWHHFLVVNFPIKPSSL